MDIKLLVIIFQLDLHNKIRVDWMDGQLFVNEDQIIHCIPKIYPHF